ncbi:MAG: hypothetical protein Q9227_009036 [Pyrenula ochraceoflavens]
MPSIPFLSNTIILLDLPPKAFCGIDLLSFTSSPNFRGIKNIPAGFHFLFTGTDASLSIRQGRWVGFANTEPSVLVFKWNATEECLIPVDNPEEVLRWKANLGSIWETGLMTYTQSAEDSEASMGDWQSLTSRISGTTLDRVLGGNEDGADHDKGWILTSVSSGPQDIERIPGLSQAESSIEGEKTLRFLEINMKQTWREGAVGRERTEAAQDKSWYLGHLMDSLAGDKSRHAGALELLGELQFAFLMVLTLSNFSCLEQWKRVLCVLLDCESALREVENFFIAVVGTLKLQLQHCEDVEGGLFEIREDGAPFLKNLLSRFRKKVDRMTEQGEDAKLSRALKGLETFLHAQYGWDLDAPIMKRGLLELEDGEKVEMEMNGAEEEEESGEFAPVVVDLEQQPT